MCRASKIAGRLPLGYLVAWLQRPHADPSVGTHADHMQCQASLCKEAGYAARVAGRDWLLSRAGQFTELLQTEARHRGDGGTDEPVRIRH